MPFRPSATSSKSEREAADGGYFGRLASARYVLLTTFEPDGTQESPAACTCRSRPLPTVWPVVRMCLAWSRTSPDWPGRESGSRRPRPHLAEHLGTDRRARSTSRLVKTAPSGIWPQFRESTGTGHR